MSVHDSVAKTGDFFIQRINANLHANGSRNFRAFKGVFIFRVFMSEGFRGENPRTGSMAKCIQVLQGYVIGGQLQFYTRTTC
jgi:hypothetical protein